MAAQLRANLGEVLFAVAYNEFCAPTLEDSVGALIKHYVRIFDVSYIRDQVYLNPHPKELMLRNHV